MATIVTTDTIGEDTQFTLTSFGSLLLADGVTIGSTVGDAIVGNGSGIKIILNGTVIANGDGVDLGDQTPSLPNSLTVGVHGSILANGIGAVVLYNQDSHLTNLGEISGAFAGVWLSASAGLPVVMVNAGTISGLSEGIHDEFSSSTILTNTGTIIGGTIGSFDSSDTSLSENTIHNRGLMVGDILFSQGHDTYDGRGGTVEGTVYGGADSDTFMPGLSEETFDGGDGNDLLDLSHTAGVRASLDNSVAGTGVAAGDTYLNIENITGSRLGADKLYGDSGNNVLSGLGGADLLSGGLGRDTLIGGTGADVLTGGGGNDAFVFNSLADAGDRITDFGASAGNNDILRINAAAFGGGMTAGALNHIEFQSSVDNVALDANVRFIYKTADATLWFDVNGSAAGGLTLVAHLQANAVFGFADILLT